MSKKIDITFYDSMNWRLFGEFKARAGLNSPIGTPELWYFLIFFDRQEKKKACKYWLFTGFNRIEWTFSRDGKIRKTFWKSCWWRVSILETLKTHRLTHRIYFRPIHSLYPPLVGTTRFELATPCTPCKCATGLRYVPKRIRRGAKVGKRSLISFQAL